MLGEKATNQTMTVLTALLIVAIAAGAVLFFLVVRGPSFGRFEAATPTAIECPTGTGAPVCYAVDVTNVGDAARQVRCQVTPGLDTAALFANGDDLYVSAAPIEARSVIKLFIQVSPSAGTKIVSRPSVSCDAA
ncbi:MAG: hypothetical protein ABI572_09870 [Actinomycetota bacterium]